MSTGRDTSVMLYSESTSTVVSRAAAVSSNGPSVASRVAAAAAACSADGPNRCRS
jgi:hypothetical protein